VGVKRLGVAHKTETDAGRDLIRRLKEAATVKETPRLMELLAGDPTFLDALVCGLEWTAANVEGFGHPTISLEEDPEEDTEYIEVEFPVTLDVETAVHRRVELSGIWMADVWAMAPVGLCFTEEFV
jgi:hypothetical protein